MKIILIIGTVILTLFIISALAYVYYFQQTDKTKCEFGNANKCDISCEADTDCKFSIGYCVNINENVYLPENVMPAYMEATCKCENKKCVGEPTGRAVI